MIIPEQDFSVGAPHEDQVPVTFTPTVPLRLISEIAWTLAGHPHEKLSIHEDYTPHIQNAAGSVLLREIMHQIEQGQVSDPHAPAFPAERDTIQCCSKAEERFLDALSDRKQSVRIVADEFSNPIIFQKNVDGRVDGVRLGLTLHDLTVGTVTYPPGMIVKVRSPHKVTDKAPVTILPHDQVTSLTVLRVSAFALPPWERRPFLAYCDMGGGVDTISIHHINESVRLLAQSV